jgi:WD40 repeat protein
MKSSRITWLAFASVAMVLGCGDRVLVGQQPSGLGAGATSSGAPPVNQAPPPSQTMQPSLPPTQPVLGTPPPSCPSTSPAQFVPSPEGSIFSLAYSLDGKMVAVGTEAPQPNVHLWNAADLTVLRDVAGHGPAAHGVTYAVAFSPDSLILATAGLGALGTSPGIGVLGTEMVKLWDVASGNLLRVIPAHSGVWVESLAFSHDGTLLATGSGPLIEIWRVADGTLLTSIHDGDANDMYGLHFSPDDTRLISAEVSRVANIWRVVDGAKLLTLSGDTGEIADAVFSPDGKEIATASYDYTVRRWDAETGAPLETLTGHSAYLSRVRWIDQDHLASNDWKGTVILWTRDASGAFTISCSLSTVTQSLGLDVSPDRTKLVASGGATPDGQHPGFWIFSL